MSEANIEQKYQIRSNNNAKVNVKLQHKQNTIFTLLQSQKTIQGKLNNISKKLIESDKV